jgi:lysylphosphatidylglycerol synthetase-like protein (DUF2156 family)
MGSGNRLFQVYVGLAVVGAIFPYLIVLPWVAQFGLSPGLFLLQVFATTPSTAFASDVIYAAAVFILFTLVEGRRLGMRGLWFPVLLVIAVGLCCALPTFLAIRERALRGARG